MNNNNMNNNNNTMNNNNNNNTNNTMNNNSSNMNNNSSMMNNNLNMLNQLLSGLPANQQPAAPPVASFNSGTGMNNPPYAQSNYNTAAAPSTATATAPAPGLYTVDSSSISSLAPASSHGEHARVNSGNTNTNANATLNPLLAQLAMMHQQQQQQQQGSNAFSGPTTGQQHQTHQQNANPTMDQQSYRLAMSSQWPSQASAPTPSQTHHYSQNQPQQALQTLNNSSNGNSNINNSINNAMSGISWDQLRAAYIAAASENERPPQNGEPVVSDPGSDPASSDGSDSDGPGTADHRPFATTAAVNDPDTGSRKRSLPTATSATTTANEKMQAVNPNSLLQSLQDFSNSVELQNYFESDTARNGLGRNQNDSSLLESGSGRHGTWLGELGKGINNRGRGRESLGAARSNGTSAAHSNNAMISGDRLSMLAAGDVDDLEPRPIGEDNDVLFFSME
jgi:hypothetical protein